MRGRGSVALADLLDDPGRLAGMVADPAVLDEARSVVSAAASAAVEVGGWTSDDPLRLSKGPVTWLLRCPRRALADPDASTGNPDDIAIGKLIDAGAKLATLRPTQPVTVETALAFLAATGDTTVHDHLTLLGTPSADGTSAASDGATSAEPTRPPQGSAPSNDGADGERLAVPALPAEPSPAPAGVPADRADHPLTGVAAGMPAGESGGVAGGLPARMGTGAAREVVAEAQARLDVLLEGWPEIEGRWWPRVEEPARLRLAEGAVVLSGRLDVLLGGPPTALPGLIVEVKSGRWHDAVRSDGHLYGLLLGLRDGVPPAAVLSVAAGDGATQLEPMRAEVLLHAADRVAEALRVAASLAAGESPTAHPGTHCTYCPLQSACPESQAAAA